MWELFAFGTFWFWLLVLAELGVLFACTAAEGFRRRGLAATASLITFLAVLQFLGGIPVWQYIVANPVTVVVWVLLYLLGGVGWVFPRWWLFVKDHRRKYDELKQQFLDSKGAQVLTPELLEEWAKYFESKRGYGGYYDEENHRIEFKPRPRDHQSRIITWMCMWPLNLLWTLLNDPVVRFFRHIYYEIAGLLQKISDNAFKDVEGEYDPNKKRN